MRLVFGPSIASRTRPSTAEVLLAISLVGIDVSADGQEAVTVGVAGVSVPPAVRPTRVFAVYAPEPPADGVTPEEHLSATGHFVGVAEVPAPADPTADTHVSIEVKDVPEGTPYHVQTIIEYPDAA